MLAARLTLAGFASNGKKTTAKSPPAAVGSQVGTGGDEENEVLLGKHSMGELKAAPRGGRVVQGLLMQH